MFNFIFTADKNSKKTLYEQLYSYVVREIHNKNLVKDERMPSKKALAKYLGISVNTVETAYSILVQEGYLRSVPRSGYYVCHVETPVGDRNFEYTEEKKEERIYKTDFRTNTVDVNSFPFSTWVKLSKEVMYSNPEYLNAGDMKGDYELRESIAKYLHEFRGVSCLPAQIVVGAGIEYLTMLLTELFDRKSVFAVENPGYKKITAIFTNNNRKINYIDVDEHGLCIDKLKETNSDIVYVTPSHQFPTGAVMTIGRRMELLSWAEESDKRYIIEDDYNSEFNFSVKPVPAMQGLANSDKVIYLSTFSRVLAPSIRIAYMVLPKGILKKFDERFKAYSSTVSRFEQHTLNKFISGGYYSRHLSRVKNIYKKRRDKLLDALAGFDVKISGERAGLHIVVKTENSKEIIKSAEEKDIKLYDMDDYYINGQGDSRSVIIGYAGASDEDIADLIEILKENVNNKGIAKAGVPFANKDGD